MKLTLAVDVHKKRFVSICDIDGAYLHAHMDEFLLMKFEGHMAKLLSTIQEILAHHQRGQKGSICMTKACPIWMY